MPWRPLPRIAFAVATYPFQPSSPSDLPLELGDELYIIEQGGKDGSWYRGYLVAPPCLLAGLTSVKGQTLEARVFSGIFPKCCVEVREELGEANLARNPPVGDAGGTKHFDMTTSEMQDTGEPEQLENEGALKVMGRLDSRKSLDLTPNTRRSRSKDPRLNGSEQDPSQKSPGSPAAPESDRPHTPNPLRQSRCSRLGTRRLPQYENLWLMKSRLACENGILQIYMSYS